MQPGRGEADSPCPHSMSGLARTASQDCAEPQGEEPEVQRKLQERSKPTGLCLLPCTLDPENRVKPTPSGWERAQATRPVHGAQGQQLQAGPPRHAKHRQGPHQRRKAPAWAPTVVPHGEHQPTARSRTGRLLHRVPLNAAGVTGTREASQHLIAQGVQSAAQPLTPG